MPGRRENDMLDKDSSVYDFLLLDSLCFLYVNGHVSFELGYGVFRSTGAKY